MAITEPHLIHNRIEQWEVLTPSDRHVFEIILRDLMELRLPIELATWSSEDIGSGGFHLAHDSGRDVYLAFFDRSHQSDTTVAYGKLYNDATSDGTSGDTRSVMPLGAGEHGMVIWTHGERLGAGVVVAAHTSATGTSTSQASERPAGFMITSQN